MIALKTIRDEMISHSPVKLIDEVILRAFLEKASDIHVEAGEYECNVRMRIDGLLVLIGQYKKEIHEEAVARLKVLSSLRTDVRTSPQDGRFKVIISSTCLSVRLSIVPAFYGEKCVLRLLPQTTQAQTFDDLGFDTTSIEKINNVLRLSHGMVLVVGPTGSGKTTTLYTLLRKISSPDISIVTLEDPIEYSISGITQIPVHAGANLTFATALRAVVRQDPDVIMVGEIRDVATAELSTHAALTGHLLLSTLHTNDAVTALPRLVDMGVEPFLVASTVQAIISQRLVRKICVKCKVEVALTESETEYLRRINIKISIPQQKTWKGKGCIQCKNSGYAGRVVISEILLMDTEIRSLVMKKASADVVRESAIKNGMRPIACDAIQKVFQGITTIAEVATVCHP